MKKLWIGTTWKMNKTYTEALDYLHYIAETFDGQNGEHVFLVLPFIYLIPAKEILKSTSIILGAQNMHWADSGEYTGEISAPMLASIGVDLVEIGHSERRIYFNDDETGINKKVKSALQHHLIPLLCVGENQMEREAGAERTVISRQINSALDGIDPRAIVDMLIAYEPVWAIGEAGTPAKSNVANVMQCFIRELMIEKFGHDVGGRVPILYGGSVNLKNAVEFIQQPDINGLFIGRAGQDPERFRTILDAIYQAGTD